jgi:molybdopterin synthase sulfur carrier subunit
MLKILYFASVREKLGHASEDLALPDGVTDVAGLLGFLAQRGEPWESLATFRNLRCAVNQELVALDAPLGAGDEVAFFPPVTGG